MAAPKLHTAPRTADHFEITRIQLCDDGMATIYEPDFIKQHQLAAISRFLESKNCHLQLDFGETYNEEVLRVSMYPGDATLKQWLTEEFPEWQKNNRRDGEAFIAIAPNAWQEHMPRQHETIRPTNPVDRFRLNHGHHTGPAAGVAFNITNWAMLASAFSSGVEGIDASRVVSALAYILSSTIVMAYSGQPVTSRPLTDLVQEAIKTVEDPTLRTALESNRHRLGPMLERLEYTMRNHPWEVKGIVDFLAGASMTYGALNSGNTLTAASAMIGIASTAASMIPARHRDSLLDPQWVRDIGVKSGFNDFINQQREAKPWVASAIETLRHGWHWLQENNLFISGALGAVSSVGYMISGLFGRKDHKPDAGLFVSGLSALAGNFLKALSIQKPTYNINDLGFATAYATYKTLDGNLDTPALDATLADIARSMAEKYETTMAPAAIVAQAQGVISMMKREGIDSLLAPDAYIANMPWDELRHEAITRHSFLPASAANEAQAGNIQPAR